MRYASIPSIITAKEVLTKDTSFSSARYRRVEIPNRNVLRFRDFLNRDLNRADLGNEVGSLHYLPKSSKYFFRTKGLQAYSFLPEINPESLLPVNPKAFRQQNLSSGDLIISKDSNIGEMIILDRDYPDWMLSSALFRLPILKWPHYLLAFVKHASFREQLDLLVPKSATIRHAKTLFLDCLIPLPSTNTEATIHYVECLVRSIIRKERGIREKHDSIYNQIRDELVRNQAPATFRYSYPRINEVRSMGRTDSKLYCEYFKRQEFLIRNYAEGAHSIHQLGFDVSRGQNLQVSCIGKSIYLDRFHPNFYSLILPKNLSIYGTVNRVEYLGNRRKLKTLKRGDIIFGAEGFEKGRSIVLLDDVADTITNIHGITLHHQGNDLNLSIWVKCFLDYLRRTGLVDLLAVGGNGGSLAMQYWESIPFPRFDQNTRQPIVNDFHNPLAKISGTYITLETFEDADLAFHQLAGVADLDRCARLLRLRLDEVLNDIVLDKPVTTDFTFLETN